MEARFSTALLLISILFISSAIPALSASSSSLDCSSLILNMADCLSFVTSGSTVSTPEGSCCSGLKMVLKSGPECLCEAFKSSASMGVTLNVTKAASLPAACKVHAPPSANCGLSVPPASAPGMSPTAAARAPEFSAGANVVAPAPAPESSESYCLTVSVGTLISGLFVVLFS